MAADEIRLIRALRQASEELTAIGVPWALVGGLAVGTRAEPRFTRDVDLAVAVADDRAAEVLLSAMQGRGYKVLALVEQDRVGRLATARLSHPREGNPGVVLDLLLASSGVEPEIAAAAETLEVFPGLHVPVARLGHLLALKVLARDDRRRPLDRVDLGVLLAVADETELARARQTLALIEARGFARNKALIPEFEALIQELHDVEPPGSNDPPAM